MTLPLGRCFEKGGGGVAMRLFRRDRLAYPPNLGFEIGDIGIQFRHPQQVERGGKQKFFCRPGEIFVGICHSIPLTTDSVGSIPRPSWTCDRERPFLTVPGAVL